MFDKRRSRVVLFAAAGAVGLWAAALARPSGGGAADGRAAIDRRAIEKAVFRCWREVTCTKAGRVRDQPCELNCWRLGAETMAVWEYSGDLSPAELPWEVRIDPTRKPMRLDVVCYRGRRKEIVLPGIFKFQDGHLIWVTPDSDAAWPPLSPSGEYAGRPTDFTSTRANGQDRRVLAPCALYEQWGAR